MKNFTGFMGSYYQSVATNTEKFYIPEAFPLDYTLERNAITIYGLMSDNDPRKSSNNVDAKNMLIRITDVMNPNQVYRSSELEFYVKHERYTYNWGPKLVIHETKDNIDF